MPTWREWLSNVVNDYDGLDEVGMPFIETDYFKKWNSFINNQKLKEIAEKYSLEIIFFPHRNMQKFIENFQTDNKRVKFAKKNEWDIQELLKSCAMLITEYSSVFWDVVYMKKPVVFYQFDTEKFRRYQYGKGWFDYENNTFGKCCTTEGSCIEEIIKEKLCNSTLQLLRGMTFIPAHSFQELHDDSGIFGSLGTISQTGKKYFLVYQLH